MITRGGVALCAIFLVAPFLFGQRGASKSAEYSELPAAPALSAPDLNAPGLQVTTSAPQVAATDLSQSKRIAPKYEQMIFSEEVAQPLSAGNKLMYGARQIVQPAGLVPELVAAGYEQLTDDDPKYGSDSAAFGERLGAAALRDDSYRILAEGVLPILFHEDPRYYRMSDANPVKTRIFYAIRNTVLTRDDNGHTGPNYAGILGRGMGAALTYTYYPDPSRSAGVVLTTFGTAVAGLAALNVIRELIPRKAYRTLNKFHVTLGGD